MIKPLFFAAAFLFAIKVNAQSADTVKKSPVRTLTYQQYNAYLKGEAANEMAMVAEINHYPMPDKVLKLKKELDLSPIQIKNIEAANNYMNRRRLQIGGSVISTERLWIAFSAPIKWMMVNSFFIPTVMVYIRGN